MVPTSFQCSPAMVLEQTSAASPYTRRLPRIYPTAREYSYMALDMLKKEAKRVKLNSELYRDEIDKAAHLLVLCHNYLCGSRAHNHTGKRVERVYLYKGNVFIHSRNRPFTKINVNLVQMGDHMWLWQAKWCKIQDRYFNHIQQQISHSTEKLDQIQRVIPHSTEKTRSKSTRNITFNRKSQLKSTKTTSFNRKLN